MTAPHDAPTRASGTGLDGAAVASTCVRWFFIASVFWLFIGLFAGLTYALQFITGVGEAAIPPNPVHSAARLRMVHASSMIYGFLLNAFLGALLGLRGAGGRVPFVETALGWLGFIFYQASLLGGITLVLYQGGQALTWGEIAPYFDAVMVLGLALVFISYFWGVPSAAGGFGPAYPFLAVAAGSGIVIHAVWGYLPQFELAPVQASRLAGFMQAHLINLFLIPLSVGLAIGYMSRYSPAPLPHARMFPLIAILFLITGILGGAELYLAPIGVRWPVAVSSVAYELVFAASLIAVWRARKSMKAGGAAPRTLGVWILHAIGAGWIVAIQRAMLIFGDYVRSVEFTEWVIGHHHLLFLGLFGFVAFGLIYHIWPRGRTGAPASPTLLGILHLTLTTLGLVFMVLSLMGARYVQVQVWDDRQPWVEMLDRLQPFWILRFISGVMIAAGQVCLLFQMISNRRRSSGAETKELS